MKLITLVLLLLLSALLTPSVSAQAESESDDPVSRVFAINRFTDNVDRRCPKGSVTIFETTVRVHPDSLGEFVDGDRGKGVLRLQSGRKLVAPDYHIPGHGRRVEFSWFAHRQARIDDDANNRVRVEVVGENMTFRRFELDRNCTEDFGKQTEG